MYIAILYAPLPRKGMLRDGQLMSAVAQWKVRYMHIRTHVSGPHASTPASGVVYMLHANLTEFLQLQQGTNICSSSISDSEFEVCFFTRVCTYMYTRTIFSQHTCCARNCYRTQYCVCCEISVYNCML